ncbi:hypothetical protein GCM10023196_036980 [Actinoallomurus vinaceus]|uniref:Uncharacterized protein n=1 Tax=Actinoallomurus vinaceus TaxID=1080074 RepID=A0ABP8U9E8_9ACTN
MKRVTVNIGTIAAILHSPGGINEHHLITNKGPTLVYLGGAGVTPSTGLPFPPGSRLELHGNAATLYAVTATGAGQVAVAVNVL